MLLTRSDEGDVNVTRSERCRGVTALAALQIDRYSNTFKSSGIVGINSVTAG
jgi:hypothetical protein